MPSAVSVQSGKSASVATTQEHTPSVSEFVDAPIHPGLDSIAEAQISAEVCGTQQGTESKDEDTTILLSSGPEPSGFGDDNTAFKPEGSGAKALNAQLLVDKHEDKNRFVSAWNKLIETGDEGEERAAGRRKLACL